ncbi:MAG: PKD domain-containing protein [Chitinophagales bacterium]|nr:PKD domain-containing protein [Chitinophagales bacterium]
MSNYHTCAFARCLCCVGYTFFLALVLLIVSPAKCFGQSTTTTTLSPYDCLEQAEQATIILTVHQPIYPLTFTGTNLFDAANNQALTLPYTTDELGDTVWTFTVSVHRNVPWTLNVTNGDGTLFSHSGNMVLPEPIIVMPESICLSDSAVSVYEWNCLNGGINYQGNFFADGGIVDMNDGCEAIILPLFAGIADHTIAYCVMPENGTGPGYGEGLYAESCGVCTTTFYNITSYCPPTEVPEPIAAFVTTPAATTVPADTLYICQGQSVYFHNQSLEATDFHWDFGDGNESVLTNPSHTFEQEGVYEVNLIAYNANSQAGTICGVAVDDVIHTNTNTPVSFNLTNNDMICGDFSILGISGGNCLGNTCFWEAGSFTIDLNTGVVSVVPNGNLSNSINYYTYYLQTDEGISAAQFQIQLSYDCLIANDDQVVLDHLVGGITIDALDNDFNACMSPNETVLSVLPSTSDYGVFAMLQYNTIWYTPNSNMLNMEAPIEDCFLYVIQNGMVRDTGEVCVTITKSCILNLPNQNLSMLNNGDSLYINAHTIQPLCSGLEPTVHIIQPMNGNVVVGNNFLGNLYYTPNSGFVGTDCFTYYFTTEYFANGTLDTISVCVEVLEDGGLAIDHTGLNDPTYHAAKLFNHINLQQNNTDMALLSEILGATDTARLVVVVGSGDLPPISCVGTVCSGDTLQYSTTAICDNYTWTVAGGELLAGQSTNGISVVWADTSQGTISLQTNNCNPALCPLPLSIPIGIIPEHLSIMGDTTVCLYSTHTYTLPTIAGATYQWTIDPPTAAQILSDTHTPSLTVQWIGENANLSATIAHQLANCSATAQTSINVRPAFHINNIYYSICENETPDLFVNEDDYFMWSVDGGEWIDEITLHSNTLPIGEHIIVAITDSDDYCNTTDTTSLVVWAIPQIPTPIDGPNTICPNQIYTYSSSSSTPNTQLFWTITGGTIIGGQNTNSVQVQWNAGGSHSLSAQARYTIPIYQCYSPIQTLYAYANANHTIVGDTTVCAGATQNYSVVSNLASSDFVWSISPVEAGTILTGQGDSLITVIWGQDAPLQATISAASCGATANMLVDIHPNPMTPTLEAGILCLGGNTHLIHTSASPNLVAMWSDNAGNMLQVGDTLTITQAGVYQLTTQNNWGCEASNTINVNASPLPLSTIFCADDRGFCIQQPQQTATISAALGQNQSYQWYVNGVALLNETNPVYTHLSGTVAGNYNYQLLISNTETQCAALSNAINIVQIDCVNSGGITPSCPDCPPVPVLTCDYPDGANADFSIINTNNDCNLFTLQNLSSPAAETLYWYFGDGTFNESPNTTTPFNHVYTEIGEHSVRLLTSYPNLNNDPPYCYWLHAVRVSVPVKAKAGMPTKVCVGDTVLFEDYSIYIPTSTITNWTWSFGDGTVITGEQNPQHIYSNSGIYPVQLTITNDTCSDTYMAFIQVSPLPTAHFTPIPLACVNSALQLLPADSLLLLTQWTFGNGDSSLLALPNYSYPNVGNYTLSLSATNTFGCSATHSQAIEIIPDPSVLPFVASDSLLCVGDTATLTAPANGIAYWWSDGSTTPQIGVMTSGNYWVRVYTSANCYYTTPIQYINFYPNPPTTINVVNNDAYLCEGETIGLQAALGYHYLWSNNATTSSINVTQSGTYTVTISPINGNCPTTISTPLTFAPSPVANMSPNLLTVCEGQSVSLHLSNPLFGQAVAWSTGVNTNSIHVNVSGTYTVTVTANNHCTRSATAQVIVVDNPNVADFPSGCYSICENDSIVLSLPPNSSADIYWYDMLIGNTATMGNVLVPFESGDYSLVASNIYGCEAQSDVLHLDLINCEDTPLPVELLQFDGTVLAAGDDLQWISASEVNCQQYNLYHIGYEDNPQLLWKLIAQVAAKGNAHTAYKYSYFHPTQYSHNYYRLTQTDYNGKEETVGQLSLHRSPPRALPQMRLIPNPAKDHFTVSFDQKLPASCRLLCYTPTGVVIHSAIVDADAPINVSCLQWASGLYFIQLQNLSDGQTIAVEKIVVE